MVEKIIVSPESIRGLGNIVKKRGKEDYITYNCFLEEETATIGGVDVQVYEMEMGNPTISVSLSSSVSACYIGDTVTLTATVLEESTGLSGVEVEFIHGTTVIGSSTTDSNGIATYSYGADFIGEGMFTARASNVVSESISLTVSKHIPTATMSTSTATGCTLDDVTVTATVTDESGNPLVHAEVWFYSKWGRVEYLAGRYTDGNGVATYSYHLNRAGSMEVYAVVANTSEHERGESNHVSLTVKEKVTATLEILNRSNQEIIWGFSAKDSGTLIREPLNCTFYRDGTILEAFTITTGNNTMHTNPINGDYKVVVESAGDYCGAESNIVTVS